jgi:hypothetical protein
MTALPVTGVVDLQTAWGIFLEVEHRRVFVPITFTSSPSEVFEVGKPATVFVLRSYAKQEGLFAK